MKFRVQFRQNIFIKTDWKEDWICDKIATPFYLWKNNQTFDDVCQENASDLLSTSKQESKAATQSHSFSDLVRGAHASSPASSSRRHWAKSWGTRRGEAGKMPPHAKWREKGAEGGKTFCASSTPVERLQPARSWVKATARCSSLFSSLSLSCFLGSFSNVWATHDQSAWIGPAITIADAAARRLRFDLMRVPARKQIFLPIKNWVRSWSFKASRRKKQSRAVQRNANLIRSCRSRKMLKNEPNLAIRGVDTAENWPSKVWPTPTPDPPVKWTAMI